MEMAEKDAISLREFFQEKLDALQDNTNLRFDALDKALNLAREDAKDKYEHLNALRQEVTQDRGLLVKIESCKQTHSSVGKELVEIKKEISLLREAKSQVEGRAVEKVETRSQSNFGISLVVIAGLSLVSIIISIIGMLVRK